MCSKLGTHDPILISTKRIPLFLCHLKWFSVHVVSKTKLFLTIHVVLYRRGSHTWICPGAGCGAFFGWYRATLMMHGINSAGSTGMLMCGTIWRGPTRPSVSSAHTGVIVCISSAGSTGMLVCGTTSIWRGPTRPSVSSAHTGVVVYINSSVLFVSICWNSCGNMESTL